MHTILRRLSRGRRAALLGLPLAAALAVALVPAALLAQPSSQPAAQAAGRVVGRVIEAGTGAGLTDVAVLVAGTTIGTMSGVDGRFTIHNVPAGTVSLQARRIGFAPKTVTGITVVAGRAVEQSIALEAAVVQLTAQVVTAQSERGSVNAALDRQRTATGIVASIGSEQIARSPDSDAAAAVQRVSGVTVQNGNRVSVRGLGERYTTTTLNGARLPSPDPETRVVPLDLFPSGLLQSIATQKTFTPNLPGDFAGAQVDIETREFPAERVITFSASTGVNDAVTGHTVLAAPTEGLEWLGFGSRDRVAPAAVATPRALSQLQSQQDVNAAVRSLRNAWTPSRVNGLPNSSFGASIGGRDDLFGRSIGYLGSLTYSYGQEVRPDQYIANPIARGAQGIEPIEFWNGTLGRTSVLWGGMLNLNTMLGARTSVSLNNTYTRSADNEARQDAGPAREYSEVNIERTTLRYIERSVRSNQLKLEHSLTDRQQLDWSVTSAGVTRTEPDRTDLVRAEFTEGGRSFFGYPAGDPEASRRTFGDLQEQDLTGATNYHLQLGAAERPISARVGGLARMTDRDAVNQQFSVIANFLPEGARELPPEQLFASFTDAGSNTWRLASANDAGSYEARDRLGAGYAMAELPIGERLRATIGARVEHNEMNVRSTLALGTRFNVTRTNTDVLPSLVLNYALTDVQALRFSATQTLARPEYRELSPVSYLEVIGGQITKGNPNLRRSLIQNVDVKWEWFPSTGELVSIGAFAKRFQDPIERVDVASGGPSLVTFANAEEAQNVGIELELRKDLGGFSAALEPLSVFSNVTLMRSDITVGPDLSANTNSNRPMLGQAPYVVNAGLNYTPGFIEDATATVLYNVVGKRVWAAGTIPYPDIYEMPRHMLDVSLRFPVLGGVSGRLDARNLLDAEYRLQQGTMVRESWRQGRVYTLGLTWRP